MDSWRIQQNVLQGGVAHGLQTISLLVAADRANATASGRGKSRTWFCEGPSIWTRRRACVRGSIPRLIVMPSIVTRALLLLTLHNHALTVAAREGTGILKTGRNGRMRPFFYLSLLAFLLCCWYTGTGAFTFVNKAFCQPFQRLRGQGAEPPPLCVRSGTPSHTNGQGRNDL